MRRAETPSCSRIVRVISMSVRPAASTFVPADSTP